MPVCWRVQDSQRFMSVTLSNSDISLTTPRTGRGMHVHATSVFHILNVFVSLSPSPLLCSSQMRSITDKEPNNLLNWYQRTWLWHLSLSYDIHRISDRCQLEDKHVWSSGQCWKHWCSNKGNNVCYPSNCHCGTRPMIYFAHLLFFAIGNFWPVFCTTLLSPARWIFYEPGNVGFCVEDWNINMAVAPRAPLPALIQKLS